MALVTLQADPVPANNVTALAAAFVAANTGDIIELQPGPAGEDWDLNGARIGSSVGGGNALQAGITLRGQDLGGAKVKVLNGALTFVRIPSAEDFTMENLEFGTPAQTANGRQWLFLGNGGNITLKNLVYRLETTKNSTRASGTPFGGAQQFHSTINITHFPRGSDPRGVIGDILLENVEMDLENDPSVDRSDLDASLPESDASPNWKWPAQGTHTGLVWHSYAVFIRDPRATSVTLRNCSIINATSKCASITDIAGPILVEKCYMQQLPKASYLSGLPHSPLGIEHSNGSRAAEFVDSTVVVKDCTFIADQPRSLGISLGRGGGPVTETKSSQVTKCTIQTTKAGAAVESFVGAMLHGNSIYFGHNKLQGDTEVGYLLGRTADFASFPATANVKDNAMVGNNNSKLTPSDVMVHFVVDSESNVFAGDSSGLCRNDGEPSNLATGCGAATGGLGAVLAEATTKAIAAHQGLDDSDPEN